jgi:putative hydrolase of the HAD superfamily
MSLAHEQTVAEAPRPLPVLRYMSFDVVGMLIDLKSVIKDRHAAIAAGAKIKIDDEKVLKVYAQACTNPPQGVRCPDDLGRFYSVVAAHFGFPGTEDKRQFMIQASQRLSQLRLRSNELKESMSHNRRIGNAYMTGRSPTKRWIATTQRSKTQSTAG